jgi:ABC-type glycerol-3-phosphate transport system permease component
MALDAPAGVTVVNGATSTRDDASYVDWPAIIAGILLASAISLVFISFGSAVGLNFLDFDGEGASPIWVGIAAASWFLWVQISSFMAGGYLTGRLRRRHFDASEHESDVRDGAHGLLVWAGAAVLGTIIAVGGIGAAANAVGNVAATATNAASNAADVTVDPNAYFIDTLFRANQPAAGGDTTAARDEAGRIFAQAALGDGTIAADDKTYLANVVAANTGLTPEEASARVDQVAANVETARQQAIEAARIARNTGIIAAFLIAASLLISAIGAYWAAQKGGNHRDSETVFTDVFRRF